MLEVLLVDDDAEVLAALSAYVRDLEPTAHVRVANDGAEGLRHVHERAPHVLLCDIQMPSRDGIALVQAVQASYPSVRCFLMTAFLSNQVRAEAEVPTVRVIPKERLVEEVPLVLARTHGRP